MAPAVILRPQRLPPRLPWVCLAQAAFGAAPVTLAGSTVDVLAMQLSIGEEDRAMTGGHN